MYIHAMSSFPLRQHQASTFSQVHYPDHLKLMVRLQKGLIPIPGPFSISTFSEIHLVDVGGGRSMIMVMVWDPSSWWIDGVLMLSALGGGM